MVLNEERPPASFPGRAGMYESMSEALLSRYKVAGVEERAQVERLLDRYFVFPRERLLALLEHDNPSFRQRALTRLRHTGLSEDIAFIHTLAGDPDPSVRAEVAETERMIRLRAESDSGNTVTFEQQQEREELLKSAVPVSQDKR